VKALDTNVLIRFLVKDDKKQSEIVYAIFKQAELNDEILYVPLLVVLETIWVLESVYQVSRNDIINSINDLLLMPVIELEAQPTIQDFISSARETKTDLSDLLIAQTAISAGCESILTFDKRASNFEFFSLLK
jgi:predicted nucleic-acid-binding protein